MARDALPGGAPIKKKTSKAACKYGARVNGKCPKAPCKYGPRDSEGYCPKKPTTSQPKAAPSSGAKTSGGKPPCKYGPRIQDRDTGKMRCPKASEQSLAKQLGQGVQKSAETAVARTLERAAKDAVAAYKKDPEKVTGQVAELTKFLGKLGLIGAVIATAVALGKAGGLQAKRQRDDAIEVQVFKTYVEVKGKLLAKGQWKQEYANMLIPQYRAFYLRQALRFASAGGK